MFSILFNKDHFSTMFFLLCGASSFLSKLLTPCALDRHYCLRCSAAQTAQIPGFLRCHFRGRLGARPTGRRRLHHERHLEMVLLHQPSLGRRGHGVRLLLTPYPRPSRHQDFFQRQAAAAQRPGSVCTPSRSRLPVSGLTMGWHYLCCES
jgi:hypothetical protein